MFLLNVNRRQWLMGAAALVSALGVTLPSPSHAQSTMPDQIVKTTSEDVLNAVAQDKDLQNGNMTKLIDLIETKIVPHFDVTRMTRLAVGKNWKDASPEQQKALTKEFQTLLVRSYATAYTAYRQVKVEVEPLKLAGDEKDVMVKTKILLPGGAPPADVNYAMRPSENGWKVFDVIVGGVSLVTTYRNDFSAQIQQSGIDGLIKNLQDRNARLAQGPAKKQ